MEALGALWREAARGGGATLVPFHDALRASSPGGHLLPPTFVAGPVASPLETLARTFGGELQWAENAMAAIMRS